MKGALDNETSLLFKHRSPDEIEAFFREYYIQIRYYAQKHIHDRQDAEDITIQVFMQFFELEDCFTSEKHVRNSLYHIASKRCIDHQRKISKRETYKIDFSSFHEKDHFEALMDISTQHEIIEVVVLKQVYNEVEKLPPQCREIFKLKYFTGLPSAEIATLLSISPQTVRSQKRRAVALLRKRLTDNSNALVSLILIGLLKLNLLLAFSFI
jgi:RNA polymerase sigma-70 factor (ECF subfamily)